jgi:predicted permease
MLHEWRAAVRSVTRRRGLALAIVLTLALGIGANSAIFSAIDAVLLKPLPYPSADRLVALYESNTSQRRATGLVAPVRLEEWNRATRAFDGLAGSYFENDTDTSGPMPQRVEAMRVSPRFFTVLGTPAALGRTPNAAEETFGGPAAVVISDAFWRARFDAAPDVVGRTLVLNGASRTIVGVMPASFRYPTAKTEAWLPAQMSSGMLALREARFYKAVGRLKPGVAVDQGRAELAAIQDGLGEQFPKTDKGWTVDVRALKEEQVGGVRRSLWLLFGAVLLVLLAACGNIACLLLADGARREQDMAVRFALGASRGTLVRQQLLEGLVLALAGSAAGLLLARWGIVALRAAAVRLPRAAEITIDWRLAAFTLTLGVLTTMVFAWLPARRVTRRDVAERVGHAGRGTVGGASWLPRVLVAAQVTLAIVLLVGAGLLIRSFGRLQQVSPGFDASNVLTFRISAAWNERGDAVINRQLRTLERLAAIPGVTSAALDRTLPAGADYPPSEFKITGRDTPGETRYAIWKQVSRGYFATMRIPVLQGETCRDDARAGAPDTVLVNRAFAERYFPGENPLGQRIGGPPAAREIIGVVADVREQGLATESGPVIYGCGLMRFWPDPYYLVRGDASRGATLAAIRDAMREIEPSRAVYAAATLEETLSESMSQPRLNTWLLALFAATALLLAAIGLHGMLAQFVSQRRREIGLRIALGARPAQVLAQVVRHGAWVTAAGLLSGLAGAFTLARFMSTLVFGVTTHDPLTFVLAPLAIALIATIATIVPARRAVQVDPMRALRDD